MKKFWLIAVLCLANGCFQAAPPAENSLPRPPQNVEAPNGSAAAKIAELTKIKAAIAPFFTLMGAPQKGDWLERNPERGETFEEYLKNNPVTPTAARGIVYILPLGEFSAAERRRLLAAAAYLRVFYNLPVKVEAEKPLARVPPTMTRENPYYRRTQIKTTYFLRDLLPKSLPPDAAALICVTPADLYPEAGWSYVFGEADTRGRVGVVSLYRLGGAAKDAANERLLLARVLKIAMHETGHTFSMRHCTKYECLMSGTNNLGETDRRPTDVCPECAAKIAWAMNYEPAERYRKLAQFWRGQDWAEEAESFAKKAEAIRSFSEK